MKLHFNGIHKFMKFKKMYHASHFLKNAVKQDLANREKKQYSVLKARLSENNMIRLNPREKIFSNRKATENTEFHAHTEKSHGKPAVSIPKR